MALKKISASLLPAEEGGPSSSIVGGFDFAKGLGGVTFLGGTAFPGGVVSLGGTAFLGRSGFFRRNGIPWRRRFAVFEKIDRGFRVGAGP